MYLSPILWSILIGVLVPFVIMSDFEKYTCGFKYTLIQTLLVSVFQVHLGAKGYTDMDRVCISVSVICHKSGFFPPIPFLFN